MARCVRYLGLIAVLTALPTVEVSAATLFWGETVNYQYYAPDLSIPAFDSDADNGDHVVGDGIEIPNLYHQLATLDISDTNLLIDFTGTGALSDEEFNGFVLTDVFSTIPDFTSVTINPVTNLDGFDASRLWFTADQIFVNLKAVSFTSDTIVSLDVSPSPVPLPAALPMFLAGLAGLGYVGWRKKKRAAEA